MKTFTRIMKITVQKVEKVQNQKPFNCDKCDFKVNHEARLIIHKKNVNKPKVMCKKCQYQAVNKDDLMGHMKIEHTENKRFCTVCGENPKLMSSLQVHILSKHSTLSCNF